MTPLFKLGILACALAGFFINPGFFLGASFLALCLLLAPPQAQAPKPPQYDLLFIPGPNKWMVRNTHGFYLRSSLNGVWIWDDYAPVGEVFDTEEAARTALEDAKAQKELL